MAVWLRRSWFAVAFLLALVIADIVTNSTPSTWQDRVADWASTNVVNLEHHPIGALVLSSIVTGPYPGVWPVLASIGLIGASRLLGSWRTLLLCGSAHVVGTLVSEGIVAYRVQDGLLPGSALTQLDVGPSYVVVSALTLAVLAGSWRWRVVALVGLLLLSPYLFTGLSHLDVAAVGHIVSILAGVTTAVAYRYNRTHRQQPAAAPAPAAAHSAG